MTYFSQRMHRPLRELQKTDIPNKDQLNWNQTTFPEQATTQELGESKGRAYPGNLWSLSIIRNLPYTKTIDSPNPWSKRDTQELDYKTTWLRTSAGFQRWLCHHQPSTIKVLKHHHRQLNINQDRLATELRRLMRRIPYLKLSTCPYKQVGHQRIPTQE